MISVNFAMDIELLKKRFAKPHRYQKKLNLIKYKDTKCVNVFIYKN